MFVSIRMSFCFRRAGLVSCNSAEACVRDKFNQWSIKSTSIIPSDYFALSGSRKLCGPIAFAANFIHCNGIALMSPAEMAQIAFVFCVIVLIAFPIRLHCAANSSTR